MFFDPIYVFYPLPALGIIFWAMRQTRSTKRLRGESLPGSSPSGADLAATLLERAGCRQVRVLRIDGPLSDFFDPESQTVRLSTSTYESGNLGSLAAAAHEAGHAVFWSDHPYLGMLRSLFFRVALYGSSLFWLILASGILLTNVLFFLISIGILSANVALQALGLLLESKADRAIEPAAFELLGLDSQQQKAFRTLLMSRRLRFLIQTVRLPSFSIPMPQRVLR